jgi:hypothetical protein
MTDFRALCLELVAWADKTSAHYYQSPDVLIRARAALAESQPAADGEVAELKACLSDSLWSFCLTQDLTMYPADHWSRRAAELLEQLAGRWSDD